jgi:hypothetical protein
MFNIVKRQDFMLGQDVPTWQEAEELRLEKYGRNYIVVIPAGTEPGKVPTPLPGSTDPTIPSR